jgi:hypothetical protein
MGNMVTCGSTGIRGELKAKTMMMESVHAAADSTTMRAVNEKYDAMWRTSSSNAFFLACTSLKVIRQASTVFKTAVQIGISRPSRAAFGIPSVSQFEMV